MAGTIIALPNGKFKLTFMKHKERYYKTVAAKDKKEARRLLNVFMKFVDKTVDIDINVCTFQDFCLLYFKDYAPALLAEECIYNYSKALENWVLPKMGNRTLADCTTKYLKKYFKWLLTQISPKTNAPLSVGSVDKLFGIVSSVFSCAVQWKILAENPLKNAKPDELKGKNKNKNKSSIVTQRCLTLEESKTLIKALKTVDLKYQLITHIAIIGGLRRSEILGLKWCDVDFKESYIKLQQSSIYVPKKGYVEGNLKNDPSERIVSLPKVTMKLLLDYKLQSLNTDNNFIFINDKGRRKGLRMNPTSVTAWFKRFRESIGLPEEVPLHGLRHTSATILLTNGIDIKNISSRLGHSQTATTLNTYSHALVEIDKDAANTLDKVLFKRKTTLKIKKKKKAETIYASTSLSY